MKTKTIILTGGIGSGKSLVSSILQELGAVVINADQIGHEVAEPGTPGLQEIVDTFGSDVLTPSGNLDRKKLAQKVFNDTEALKKLNQILHPKVDAEIERRIQQYQEQGHNVVFVETALVTGVSWMTWVEDYWIVKTSKEAILNRLKGRGMSESESLARMASQTPVENNIKHGRIVIIQNDGSAADLKSVVEKLWLKIHNGGRD